jgi:hypothetical protein
MPFTGQQSSLFQAAQRYIDLGYTVGLTKGKSLVMDDFVPNVKSAFGRHQANTPSDFDGISIIPDRIVCVDIDVPDFSMFWDPLPPTWKEKTPRGFHLFYSLQGSDYSSKIKWLPHVDLLVKSNVGKSRPGYSKRPDGSEIIWGEHVICSPTPGYTCIYPDQIPENKDLTPAPTWLIEAIKS